MNPHQAEHDGPMHQHIDAELDILGGCLHAPRHIPAVRNILKGSDFVRPAHELIWDALGHLYDTGAPITPVSLRIELEKRKELTRAGGLNYITQIGNHLGSGDPEYWAEEVHAAALLREEADLGRRIVQRATAPDAEPGGTVAFMEEYLQRHKDRTTTGGHLTSAFLDWDPFFNIDFGKVELLPGRLMGPGQQITIVGDGKAGKSLLVQEWLWRMASGQPFLGDRAHDPVPLLYVDAENGHQDIQERFLSYGAGPGRMGLMSYASFPPIRPLDTAGGGTDLLDMVKECEAPTCLPRHRVPVHQRPGERRRHLAGPVPPHPPPPQAGRYRFGTPGPHGQGQRTRRPRQQREDAGRRPRVGAARHRRRQSEPAPHPHPHRYRTRRVLHHSSRPKARRQLRPGLHPSRSP
ncbi:hypothetical protein RKD45_002476 [Streptomyces griseus]